MNFYDLSKGKREELTAKIKEDIQNDIEKDTSTNTLSHFSNEDTYIRKNAYLSVGRLYFINASLQSKILILLKKLFDNSNENVRQSVVNALGEVGKKDTEKALPIFEKAMVDESHEVRNAVIGSLKKMGEKNPKSVLSFSRKFLHHQDPEIRRQAIHGIELRGRTHPEDVLSLLEELQFEQIKRVRDVVVHVLGQISYKKGCLETHKAYEKFSGFEFDWENIRKKAKHFNVYHSDDDPYVSKRNGEGLANQLGVELTFIPNAGHFNKEAGYTKFESLLQDIKVVQ